MSCYARLEAGLIVMCLRGFLFPSDMSSISPQIIQIVKHPCFLAEDVNDYIDQVDAGPVTVVAAARQRAESARLAQFLHFIAGGLHLPRAGARCQHHEVRDWRKPAHIEHNHIVAARVGQQLRRVQRKLPGGRQLIFGTCFLCDRDDAPPGNPRAAGIIGAGSQNGKYGN